MFRKNKKGMEWFSAIMVVGVIMFLVSAGIAVEKAKQGDLEDKGIPENAELDFKAIAKKMAMLDLNVDNFQRNLDTLALIAAKKSVAQLTSDGVQKCGAPFGFNLWYTNEKPLDYCAPTTQKAFSTLSPLFGFEFSKILIQTLNFPAIPFKVDLIGTMTFLARAKNPIYYLCKNDGTCHYVAKEEGSLFLKGNTYSYGGSSPSAISQTSFSPAYVDCDYVQDETVDFTYSIEGLKRTVRMFVPKEAMCGGKFPLVFLLHGNTQSQSHSSKYLGEGSDFEADKILRESIDKGMAGPVILVAPKSWDGDGKGKKDSDPWDIKRFNPDKILELVKSNLNDLSSKKATSLGKTIEYGAISATGHSAANCYNGGLRNLANKYDLHWLGLADGNCKANYADDFFGKADYLFLATDFISSTPTGGKKVINDGDYESFQFLKKEANTDILQGQGFESSTPQLAGGITGNVVADVSGGDETVTLLFTGDATTIDQKSDPFANVKDYFSKSLTYVNLETVITNKEYTEQMGQLQSLPDNDAEYHMRIKTETADKYLLGAGINIVNLANNHAGDFGLEGLKDTITYLESKNMPYCGASKNKGEKKPVIVQSGNIKVGFVCYTQYVNSRHKNEVKGHVNIYSSSYLESDINAAKSAGADIVVVTIHWGKVGTVAEKKQVDGSQLAIKKGADLVIGHGPHRVQGLEYVNEKPIVYSLGNFIAGRGTEDPDVSKLGITDESKKAYMFSATYDKNKKLVSSTVLPVHIQTSSSVRGIPKIADEPLYSEIKKDVEESSKDYEFGYHANSDSAGFVESGTEVAGSVASVQSLPFITEPGAYASKYVEAYFSPSKNIMIFGLPVDVLKYHSSYGWSGTSAQKTASNSLRASYELPGKIVNPHRIAPGQVLREAFSRGYFHLAVPGLYEGLDLNSGAGYCGSEFNPTKNSAAIGAPNAGALHNGFKFPAQSNLFDFDGTYGREKQNKYYSFRIDQKLGNVEGAHYSTNELADLTYRVACHMNQWVKSKSGQDDFKLEIHDYSLNSGGEIEGHGSHENGIDADWGFIAKKGSQYKNTFKVFCNNCGKAKASENSVLSSSGGWDFDPEANWELVKVLYKFALEGSSKQFISKTKKGLSLVLLDQVYVTSMKNWVLESCDSCTEEDKVLANQILSSFGTKKLFRHAQGHHHHYHLRISCSDDDQFCKSSSISDAEGEVVGDAYQPVNSELNSYEIFRGLNNA